MFMKSPSTLFHDKTQVVSTGVLCQRIGYHASTVDPSNGSFPLDFVLEDRKINGGSFIFNLTVGTCLLREGIEQ